MIRKMYNMVAIKMWQMKISELSPRRRFTLNSTKLDMLYEGCPTWNNQLDWMSRVSQYRELGRPGRFEISAECQGRCPTRKEFPGASSRAETS